MSAPPALPMVRSAIPAAPEPEPERGGIARGKRRVIAATALGNGLIMYDFTVYSFSAVTIGKLFFPSTNPLTSLLLVFATFGAGFLMRPLGAMVIGSLADRRGRKAGLALSIVLMTLGTGLIAFTPSFGTIDIAASLLMLLARLLQGFAAGGEIGTASAALMELAPPGRRCYVTSWRPASQGLSALAGALVTAGTGALLAPEQLAAWGWRIPFVLGMLVGPVGWYIRRHMAEPMRSENRAPSLKNLLRQHRRALCCGVLLMAAPTASIYIMVFYLPSYLVSALHMPATVSLLSSCLAGSVIFIVAPLMGLLSDRQPRRKPIQQIMLLVSMAMVYPAFMILTRQAGEWISLLVICVYASAAFSTGGANSVMLLEAFPVHHRAAGMSLIYSLGSTLFGGFSPFVVTWLIAVTGNPMAPAWYLLAALGISCCALAAFPEAPAAVRHAG